MKRILLLFFITIFFKCIAFSQTINGNLTELASEPIRIEGFNGFKTYTVASTMANNKGNFKLNYTEVDYGMGYLKSTDENPLFVILSDEDIELIGTSLDDVKTIKITKGQENQWFEQYASEHPRREQALTAWDYLEKIYSKDSLFVGHEVSKDAIAKEKKRIKTEDSLFLTELPKNSYISYYLPLRKLVSSVSTIAQYRTEEIPSAIASFRAIDYTDPRLYKSGLLGDVIESHIWLIENSGRSLDSVYIELNKSIDLLIENLLEDEKKLNEITEYLFKLLEKRSLFRASEYLSLKLLNQQSCTLNNDLAAQLESYRAMKKGKTAPDFDFKKDIFAPGYESTKLPKKLSDLNNKYTLVVFGASWCQKCAEELPEIVKHYLKWKEQDVEVVFVSLDEDKGLFKSFVSIFPFISVCDYQKWNSRPVKDYHIFSTPTMYLLNDKREILLRPNSVAQMDAWVDWHLVHGNK